MMNNIYVRRKMKVILPKSSDKKSTKSNVIATLNKNLENLGFTLSKDAIEKLQTVSPKKVETFYNDLVKGLRVAVGDHRQFKPMYPNFPKQVMKMSEVELYFNAIFHYLSAGQWLPETDVKKRKRLKDTPDLKVIEIGTKEEFDNLFTLLAKSKSPFSIQDKEDVTWFIAQYRQGIYKLMPEEIPCKENLAFISADLLDKTESEDVLEKYFKTTTDVLRLAVAMSGGDVSLAQACKFRNFTRPERKRLLALVESATSQAEDMLRWKSRWIRLAEKLHPSEYSSRFPKTASAISAIRNNKTVKTFNHQVEKLIEEENLSGLYKLLKNRPGEFARRLDKLARIENGRKRSTLATNFKKVANSISTPVLLQVLTHFKHRNDDESDLRIFFPKGNVAKLYAKSETLPEISEKISSKIVKVCEDALIERFAELNPLGNCYLDERMKGYVLPFSQRSASKSLRTLVRGSRVPLPESKVLRFFVWWKNGNSRTDLDLSAVLYDENYGYAGHLSYTELSNFGGCHSGDIVDAPNGASEFIDVNINKCLDAGVRFIAMNIYSYTNQPYCDLPECFAGWMGRTKANSGEIYEPKTVVDKVDIASDTKICIPVIFDLLTGEAIWTDLALTNHPCYNNNVEANFSSASLMVKSMVELKKTDLYTLIDLHIRARGEKVDDVEEAEVVFSPDEGVSLITPFDLEEITAEYM